MFALIRRPDPSREYREVYLVQPLPDRSAISYFVAAPDEDTARDPARKAREHAQGALSLGVYLYLLGGWRRTEVRP